MIKVKQLAGAFIVVDTRTHRVIGKHATEKQALRHRQHARRVEGAKRKAGK